MNFVIINDQFKPNSDLLVPLFGCEDVEFLTPLHDMFDVLVKFGAFKSKGDARKNWTKTGRDVPPGFNEFTVGKLKKQFWVWNPV